MDVRQTTLEVGADRPFRALHLSDSHVCLADERENARKLALAKTRSAGFDAGVPGRAAAYLQEQLAYADTHSLPILHTGDFCDFVSDANLEAMGKLLFSRDCFMAAGNHEYSQYVGEAPEDEAYKLQSYDRVQACCKNDLRFASRERNGVNFVAVDNVYYNFTARQLALLEQEIAKGKPIVLLMHTPIYTPELHDYMIHTLGESCGYLVGTPEEALAAYSPERRIQQTADGPTRAFVDYVQHQPLIRAVLAGHVHHDFETRLPGGAMQLITGGGFRGCAREITFC